MNTGSLPPKELSSENNKHVDSLHSESKEVSTADVSSTSNGEDDPELVAAVPLLFKIGAILLVSSIGFGSAWSSGVTGGMKTTLKKVCPTNPSHVRLSLADVFCRNSGSITRNMHSWMLVKTSWSRRSCWSVEL